MFDVGAYLKILTNIVTVFFAVGMFFCIARIILGPKFTDRIVAGSLIDLMVISMLALIAVCFDYPALLDIALVYALLSFLAVTTFCAIFTRNLRNERNLNMPEYGRDGADGRTK
jgi:multicomponent Na+:H+ antiporter subunit F